MNTFNSAREEGVSVDLTVVAYLLYLAVVVPLTIWVGRALRRHGEVATRPAGS